MYASELLWKGLVEDGYHAPLQSLMAHMFLVSMRSDRVAGKSALPSSPRIRPMKLSPARLNSL
ncbi:hypothetical protein [Roseobacter sp.]|uniref:hypothetical protein n=1 Tax=Roseobacter sp. TaxID=1907202 RepID=UPI0038589EF2